ncbi:Crp/Fnr family transcriptional regulator [Prevotella sp. 10(H)]|uniref:Crp/Fnr family transcriptional regulator n=1 Tax=Prevotella sp. 10(H) TaxID=1158294 RepID=UPI0004A6FF84|nr:Crp/Fnr family transcriptional regulator [Prevotella sp. 10(H)]
MENIQLTDQQKNIINKIPLFRGVSEEFKKSMFDKLEYTVTRIKKGEIIIHQNSVCNHLHILLEGNLEVNIIDASANNVKVENIVAPRSFGTPHLFDGNNIFPATFTVVEDGILMKATRESIFRIISSEPELLKNFLRLTGNCNACTVKRLKILSHKSIRSRFVRYVLDHKQSESLSVMEHNQTQLAEYLGVTRPALANEIKKMTDEGLISIEGKNVEILSYSSFLQYI